MQDGIKEFHNMDKDDQFADGMHSYFHVVL